METISLSPFLYFGWSSRVLWGMLGAVVCREISSSGFPIFQYYYLAYNMGDSTVTFVDLQLSNETEAFINGPELGGIMKLAQDISSQ